MDDMTVTLPTAECLLPARGTRVQALLTSFAECLAVRLERKTSGATIRFELASKLCFEKRQENWSGKKSDSLRTRVQASVNGGGKLERETRFELATSTLARLRSTS